MNPSAFRLGGSLHFRGLLVCVVAGGTVGGMPEAAEVETVRRALVPALPALCLDAEVSGEEYGSALTLPGACLLDLSRRGKFLLGPLDDDRTLLVHLGMSGQWFTSDPDAAPPVGVDHVHVSLLLQTASGEQAAWTFRDPRRFGRFRVVADPRDLDQVGPTLARMGPDLDDPVLDAAALAAGLARFASVKAGLLSQKAVAGVGNYVADESCHRAGVCPASPMDPRLAGRLLAALREVVGEALDAGGNTLRDFRAPDGSSGSFASQLRVYGRAGLACLACGQALHSALVAGRTTVWCRTCQPGA